MLVLCERKVLNSARFCPAICLQGCNLLTMSGCGLFFNLMTQPKAPSTKKTPIEKQFLHWSKGLIPPLSCSKLNVHLIFPGEGMKEISQDAPFRPWQPLFIWVPRHIAMVCLRLMEHRVTAFWNFSSDSVVSCEVMGLESFPLSSKQHLLEQFNCFGNSRPPLSMLHSFPAQQSTFLVNKSDLHQNRLGFPTMSEEFHPAAKRRAGLRDW